MTLSKSQRLSAYEYALKRLEDEYPAYGSLSGPYMCHYLKDWCIEKTKIALLDVDIHSIFPEFNSCYQTELGYSWFTVDDIGNILRSVVLQYCIDLLNNK